jgi:sulfur-oxidizing protein SoxY
LNAVRSSDRTDAHDPRRRRVLGAGGALVALAIARPARADAGELQAAIAAYAGGRAVRGGRVTIDVARLVDNGNAVPLTLRVDSPMSAADHVRAIALFNERNPERDVARFALTERSGRAEVSTRIRLATSQRLVAVATMSDGSLWSGAVDVVVTLAACLEGDI